MNPSQDQDGPPDAPKSPPPSTGSPAPSRSRRLTVGLVLIVGAAFLWYGGRPSLPPPVPDNRTGTRELSVSPSDLQSPLAGADESGSDETLRPEPGIPPFTESPQYPAALSVAGLENESTRAEALEALMETWVADQPEQAANWAGSLPAGSFRDDALSSLMFHWAAAAPADAAAWMSRTGVDDAETASVLAGRWSASDPASAADWAGTLANLETRSAAHAAIASAWAATAPESAAVWAASLPGADRTAAIAIALRGWAGIAPAAAAQWLSDQRFPSESERAAAVIALVTPWTDQSPAAVSRFINTLPEGPAREAAASQFAVTAASSAPAEALMWAMNLRDPMQRNQVVADTCEAWLEGSPESFQAGITEALSLMEDTAMRHGVLEMLYEADPEFHQRLLQLADPASRPPPPLQDPASLQAPASPESTPTPSEGPPDASLLPMDF